MFLQALPMVFVLTGVALYIVLAGADPRLAVTASADGLTQGGCAVRLDHATGARS